MVSREEAKQILLAVLKDRGVGGVDGVTILDSHTIEKPYGWAFFYNSKKFLDSGDILDSLVGGGPVVVLAQTGMVHELGSARPPLQEIADLEGRLGLTP
jgi:hypothetical protein